MKLSYRGGMNAGVPKTVHPASGASVIGRGAVPVADLVNMPPTGQRCAWERMGDAV